jgi:hypothetical protein
LPASETLVPARPRWIAFAVRHQEAWLAFCALLFFHFLLSRGDYLLDSDAYYHIRIADLLRRQGWIQTLPWMALSVQAQRFVDFHFVFHWLQVPFVLVAPDLLAASRLSTAAFAALGVFAFGMLLRRLGNVRRSLWIVFLVLASPIFAGRWLFGRGGSLFTALLFVYLHTLASGKPRLTAVVTAASVWAYPGFPLLIVIAVLYDGARGIAERRLYYSTALAAVAGAAAGLIVHPGFPFQFRAYWLELGLQWMHPPGLEPIAEWLPAESAIMLAGAVVPAAAVSVAVAVRAGRSPLASALLSASVALVLALALSLKAIEYFVPVAAAALGACSWRPVPPRVRAAGAAAVLSVMTFWSLPQIYGRVIAQHRLTDPRAAFDAADWLAANTEQGSLVLASWGQFPRLFFRSLHNSYPFGLNPAYAYGANPARYLMIRAFIEGAAPDPLEAPRALGARQAVLHKRDDGKAIARLLAARVEVAYENAAFVVFRFQ